MDRQTISTCHSIELIPLSRISRFARTSTRVSMMLLGETIEAKAVPGSVKISSTADNGKIKKKIIFESSDVSERNAYLLACFKCLRLVVTYVDESGKRRVAGSPAWPLSLDYATEGGVFIVTLQGEDDRPDGFLVD